MPCKKSLYSKSGWFLLLKNKWDCCNQCLWYCTEKEIFISKKLRIFSYLLKESIEENFIFVKGDGEVFLVKMQENVDYNGFAICSRIARRAL